MTGTIPLTSHVPARDPMIRSMRMDGMAVLILFVIEWRIFVQETLNLNAIKPAMLAESNRITWLEPDSVSFLKMMTFNERKTIRKIIGIRDWNKLGLPLMLIRIIVCNYKIKVFLKYH